MEEWKKEKMLIKYEVCCSEMWQRLCNYEHTKDFRFVSPIWVDEYDVIMMGRCPDCGAEIAHEFFRPKEGTKEGFTVRLADLQEFLKNKVS